MTARATTDQARHPVDQVRATLRRAVSLSDDRAQILQGDAPALADLQQRLARVRAMGGAYARIDFSPYVHQMLRVVARARLAEEPSLAS